MKKRTLFVLLIAIFLMLIGISLFLFPVFTQDTILQPSVYTVSSDFPNIEIDLEKTTLTICQDETTYVEIIGYRESEYFISEENGKLLLTDRFEKTPLLFKLSGIGKYFKESRQISQSKSIVLHLSQNDLQTPDRKELIPGGPGRKIRGIQTVHFQMGKQQCGSGFGKDNKVK